MASSAPHFDSLLDKLEEVRAVFVLSKRSMPFLEEFFGFVQDVAPLIEEIDKAIRESGGEMPQAKSQLESVSQATELATTEILDLVDGVLSDLGGVEERIKRAAEREAALDEADERLMTLLRERLGPDHAALLEEAEAIHEQKQALRAAPPDPSPAEDDPAGAHVLTAVRQKMNRIMLSLQVQDITSQQIASVNHLIDSVRTRLTDLIHRFTTGADATPERHAAPATPLTFDRHARYDHAPDRQQMADALIRSFGCDGSPGDSSLGGGAEASAGDGHASNATPDAPAPDADEAAPQADAPAGEEASVSQADVDQLFGGSSGGEAASQDDIDALFQ